MKKLILACLIITFFIVACTQHKLTSEINPVQQSDLKATVKIVVNDLTGDSENPVLLLEDTGMINTMVSALDANIKMIPKTFCAPRYEIQFHHRNASIVVLNYFCDGNEPFIRSNLDYFKNEDYAAPDAFVQVMARELSIASPELIAEKDDYSPGAELANPASVFCEEQDGIVEMRTDESGGTYGVCKFANGTECEEWEFFRGECKPGN